MEPIMDAFHRLLRFGRAAKERALPVWQSAVLRSEAALQWLRLQFGRAAQWLSLQFGRAAQWLLPRVVFWAIGIGIFLVRILGLAAQWLKRRPRAVFWASGIGISLAFLVFGGPLAAGAALAGWAALRQAATASDRHQEQTNADRQRRITESFSKAVEQLGSDKPEVRLGGIYSLERISRESPDDYWTVMENLTAFVRVRSRRNEAERTDIEQRISWLKAGQPDRWMDEFRAAATKREELGEPADDISAVLTVLTRRSEQSRKCEVANGWRLNFNGAILRGCSLSHIYLEKATLSDAHLEGAVLLFAHLEGAHLLFVHLEGAQLRFAHLEGADLSSATGLTEAGLSLAYGDAATKLPEGMARPAHWPVEVT